MTKVMQIRKKNVDLAQLYQDVKEALKKDNYKITKDDVTGFTFHMRAIKTNVTRIIVGAARDIELVIAGEPNNFAVAIMVGAWGKNIAISSVTGFVIASTVAAPALAVGTLAAAGSFLTARAFEDKFHKDIEKLVEARSMTETEPPNPS
ncbi:MAG: hypothetical protein ABIJ47_12555 [Candidatus Bathyarchaeota archaeon]